MHSTISTARLAWLTLGVNMLIILQGAVVRVSGSGAGCGSHWPLCNGEVIPLAPSTETLVEYSHRLLSFGALVLGGWLLSRAYRARRNQPTLFRAASASFTFLILEALLGAATVLLGLTGDNATVGRGLLVATHLVNSVLLIGALTVTLIYARPNAPGAPKLRGQGLVGATLSVGLIGMLLLIFAGGVAAMGNTMFPSESLAAGLAADFDGASHLLIRLRVLHPLIAISVGLYLFLSLGLSWWLKPVPRARHVARLLFGVYAAQLLVGTLNLTLLGPAGLQLLHLFLAVLSFSLLSALIVYTLGLPATAEGRAAAPWHDPYDNRRETFVVKERGTR